MPSEPMPHHDAQKHLSRRCPRLKCLIKRVGPCTLQANPDSFTTLARSIVAQQISTKAASSISGRIKDLCGRGKMTPAKIATLTDEQLRGAGLSTNKLLSIRSLTDYFLDNKKTIRQWPEMSDEEVIESLLPIRGVGVWTAQMFLIFSLGRKDILPVGDLGFQVGVQELYELVEKPSLDTLNNLAEPWRPYRSIATWYLWRSRD